MIAGMSFGMVYDSTSIILTKSASEMLGFGNPKSAIGESVTIWGYNHNIIGVVADYNHLSVKNSVNPIAFLHGGYEYFTIKLSSSDYLNAIGDVEKIFSSHFPDNPFEFQFLEDHYDRQYRNEKEFSKVFTFFAGFATQNVTLW